MTRDEIKAMWIAKGKEPNSVCNTDTICEFAEHIAKLEAEKEREACAQLCDYLSDREYGVYADPEREELHNEASRQCAEVIRARGRK